MSEREERWLELAKKILQIENITLDARKENIEQWDSLAHVMLVSEFETEFHVSVPYEEIAHIGKLQDFVMYIR